MAMQQPQQQRQAFVLHGGELRALRLSVGLSQRDLAARLAYSPAQVCAWERERSAIPRGVLEAVRREVDQERATRAEWENYLERLHLPRADAAAVVRAIPGTGTPPSPPPPHPCSEQGA